MAAGPEHRKITAQHALVYNSIEKQFDLERARQYYEVNDKALELIETLIARYNIQCDFQRVPHVSSPRMRIMPKNRQEYETYQKIGLDCRLERDSHTS